MRLNVDIVHKSIICMFFSCCSVSDDENGLCCVGVLFLEMAKWEKILSEKYQQYYWFNSLTGESRWTEPEQESIESTEEERRLRQRTETESTNSSCTKERDRGREENEINQRENPLKRQRIDIERERRQEREQENQEKEEEKGSEHIEIAIIVPFRDLHIEQNRAEQLRRFVPAMSWYCC